MLSARVPGRAKASSPDPSQTRSQLGMLDDAVHPCHQIGIGPHRYTSDQGVLQGGPRGPGERAVAGMQEGPFVELQNTFDVTVA